MKPGQIYHIDLDPVVGHEQRGKRFVLVVSNEAYNRATRMPFVAAITGGGEFARMRGLAVSLSGLGLLTNGVVRLDQVRSVDLAARGGRLIESVPEDVLQDVRARLFAILDE